MIQFLQLCFSRFRSPSHPCLLPFFVAFYPQCQTVILHPVHLFILEAAQPCAKETEHTVIGKVFLRHGKQAPQILYEGIEQDTLLMIHKHRNIKYITRLFQRVRIYIHIRRDHCDITVTVSLLPHQITYTLCHIPCF